MFALYQEFQKPDNIEHFADWQRLLETHRLAKLSMLQAKVLHELDGAQDDDEDDDKPKRRGRPPAKSDVTKLMIGRILADETTPQRGPGRPPAKPPSQPPPPPEMTPEQQEMKRQQDAILATLRNGQRPPPNTPTD